MNIISRLEALPLPQGIRSRQVEGVNGLSMHVLEAGQAGAPTLLLLHGFPELAYSWRKLMPRLAAAGYYVIAPDQRGYGRTTGWDAAYDGDLASFRMTHLVQDMLALLGVLGIKHVEGLIGHDFGSPVAAWSALLHPEVYRSVVLMSSPFGGPPVPAVVHPGGPPVPAVVHPGGPPVTAPVNTIHQDLAALPRPRKHYQWYYSTREAERDMLDAPQGLHAFFRAYYHAKSADWPGNQPVPLAAWTATELARLPTYYVMDLHETMAETVVPYLPDTSVARDCPWLPDHELAVYVAEYRRNGFQGGLQWYRCSTGPAFVEELRQYHGRSIDVPAMFISGASDWGTFQKPGEFERMQKSGCTQMRSTHLIPGAGHWVQQEQPEQVASLVLQFLQAR